MPRAGKSGGILEYFPEGYTPRPAQAAALEEVERVWRSSDVIVLNMPVGSGKTLVSLTIRNWLGGKTDILVPSNVLLKQYLRDDPKQRKIMTKEQYECACRPAEWPEDEPYSCATYYQFSGPNDRKRSHCSGECPYVKDNRGIRYWNGALMNTMMYVARMDMRKYPASTVVVDEAHTLQNVIKELLAKNYWRQDWRYPADLVRRGQAYEWAKELAESNKLDEKKQGKIEGLVREFEAEIPRYSFERTFGEHRGELKDVLKLRPINITTAPPYFWMPGKVRKLVLMSATISKEDIRQLGLDSRRVSLITAESPIPIDRRPIISQSVASVNHLNSIPAFSKIAAYVNEVLAPKHEGEKGLLHTTYGSLPLLKTVLTGDRYIFHNKDNKMKKYKEFLESDPKDGKILVACGLYEGIDLKGDLGRWQAVLKVPWPSLADPAIRIKMESEPSYYRWSALKDIMQASGRICRGPDDYGVTYVLDGSFRRLYGMSEDLMPPWFTEAVEWQG